LAASRLEAEAANLKFAAAVINLCEGTVGCSKLNNNNHSDKPYLSASAPRLTLWGGGN
jgi:hypothetical protein